MGKMEYTVIDLNNVCRTCKNESSNMKSLYHRDLKNENENLGLDEMLMACSSIQVNTEDGLPKLICGSCLAQLKNAYSFKEQCEKTDAFLRDYLQNIKKINIKEETVTEETTITDMEFTPNLIGEINSALSDESCNKNLTDDIEDNPEIPSMENQEEDMDYVRVVDDITTYECKTCSKVFYTLEGIRCHKRRHTGKAFKCKQCDRSYTKLNHLRRHELSHSKRKMYVCKICNKTLTRLENLKRHLVTHLKKKPLLCRNCNRRFNRAEHLQNHLTCCKGTNVYICDICNKKFLRKDSLEVHKRFHESKVVVLPTIENLNNIEEHFIKIDFGKKTDRSDGEDLDVTLETIEPEIEVLENHDELKINEIALMSNNIYPKEDPIAEQARIKDELLLEDTNNSDAVDQQALETDNKDEFDEDLYNESQSMKKSPLSAKGRPRKHSNRYKSTSKVRGRTLKLKIKPEADMEIEELDCLETQAQQLYECDTCSKQFSNSGSLKRHRLSHEEVKPFVCTTCKKSFTRKDHLQKHMKLHLRSDISELLKDNSAEKKFECQYCPKAFTAERYRDAHTKTHFSQKNFQCRSCEKTFPSKTHLTKHMKFHNDSSKKFLCSECGQRFIRHDYLETHMRRHRGEKPFKCKFCGKGFPQIADVTVHERYHTGEKTHLCVICGKGFGRAYNLTVHMRTHTGEKPYRCTSCDAAFSQGHDLKAHVRRHTGERYQCELCPENFLMGYLLTQHKRTVHGLNIVSNIRRLQPVKKINPDDPPPITVPLPAPIVVAKAVIPNSITNDNPQENEMKIVIKPRRVI